MLLDSGGGLSPYSFRGMNRVTDKRHFQDLRWLVRVCPQVAVQRQAGLAEWLDAEIDPRGRRRRRVGFRIDLLGGDLAQLIAWSQPPAFARARRVFPVDRVEHGVDVAVFCKVTTSRSPFQKSPHSRHSRLYGRGGGSLKCFLKKYVP